MGKVEGMNWTAACAPSSRNIDFVIAIVVWGRANAPATNFVASKGAFVLSLWFIDDGLSSKRCHGRSIEFEDAKNLVVGRKLRIDTGRKKEIDSDLSLHEKLAPGTGGNLLSQPERIAVKWFLNVQMARSAGSTW